MKLGSIQSLRALAIILVAYAHSIDIQMKFSHSFQQDFFHWQNFGAFGVDIFFVISGFIICYSAGRYNGIQEAGIFLIHRFKRLLPVYYIATTPLVLLATAHWIRHKSFIIPGRQIIKSVLLLPFFDHDHWVDTILPQAWTLSYEWLFYLLFLVTILCGAVRKEVLVGILILILLTAGIFIDTGSDYRLHFITNPILSEFMLGAVIYGCYRHISLPKALCMIMLITATGICVYEIISGYGNISECGYIVNGSLAGQRALMWGIPASLLVAGCVFWEKGRTSFFSSPGKWIGLLGDASYSIYLTHLFIFQICEMIYERSGFFLPADIAIWIQLLVAVAFGILFYRWVERPLLRRL